MTHVAGVCLTFQGTDKLFSKVVVSFYKSTAQGKIVLQLLHSYFTVAPQLFRAL